MEKNIKTKVISEIKYAVSRYEMVNKGDHIVFGLSGGPDSVCLFFAFYLLREELGITMSAVHINHKFRPGAAEDDQSYVENMCEKFGIRCRSEVHDCGAIAEELGITSEEAGRKIRYEAFDTEAAYAEKLYGLKKEQVKIAIAHNMEDQAETLLFRLMRGTGTDGLAGIERKRTSDGGYTIIRPILGLGRRDIEAFCEELELAPHIDLSNLEPIYTRNKIRLGLIPYIKENFNENITEALNRLAVIAGEDKEYLRQQAEKSYKEAKSTVAADEIALDMEIMREAPNAIRHRMMLRALAELGLTQDIGAVHMEALDRIIERGTTGKTAEFPYGYSAVTRYGNVVFKKPQDADNTEKTGQNEAKENEIKAGPYLSVKIVSIKEWREYEKSRMISAAAENADSAQSAAPSPKNFAAFDYTALCEAKGMSSGERGAAEALISLRHKQPGDFIALTVGRKKVQDLLVDSKVPRDLRSSVLLAAVGSEILWMIGADSGIQGALPARSRFSAGYKISDDSAEVLILEIGS